MKGFLTTAQITEHFISLGLAENPKFVPKLLSILKPENNDEFKVRDFLKVFEYDRLGNRVCELIQAEFRSKQEENTGAKLGQILAKPTQTRNFTSSLSVASVD